MVQTIQKTKEIPQLQHIDEVVDVGVVPFILQESGRDRTEKQIVDMHVPQLQEDIGEQCILHHKREV